MTHTAALMQKPTQEQLREFVGQNVIYCVSGLIGELAQQEKYFDDISEVMGGYSECRTCHGEGCNECDDGEELIEVYEHWIVDDWFADKLAAHGELVSKDILGLTIWGRQCSGQAIMLDYVIEAIWTELHN